MALADIAKSHKNGLRGCVLTAVRTVKGILGRLLFPFLSQKREDGKEKRITFPKVVYKHLTKRQ
jgi:hypothetical protein